MARSDRKSSLRIIVFQEGDWLCAQCVDYNLAVQAKTMDKLYKAMHRLVAGHVAVRRHHHRRPFEDLPPAPEKYRRMFERSKIDLPQQIMRAYIRRASGRSIPPPAVRVEVPA
jgi:hypothetical protein